MISESPDAQQCVHPILSAAWWFDQGRVAGMARPGFNACHWYDLSHEEAAVLTWLGSGAAPMRSFDNFALEYVRLREPALGSAADGVRERLRSLHTESALQPVIAAVCARTSSYSVAGGALTLSNERLQQELAALAEAGFTTIVSLLEQPPDPATRSGPLEMVHLPTPDMLPPRLEDVQRLADLIEEQPVRQIAVHCLAGMGRTTTMLMAAHIVLGHTLEEVRATVEKQNPRYRFAGPQWSFLESLNHRICNEAT